MVTCPRCGQQQTPAAAECAGCGVILAKALPSRVRPLAGPVVDPLAAALGDEPDAPPLLERAVAVLMDEERADSATLYGRVVLLIALLGWTWTFASASVASNAAGESWLHLPDLVFHEAGHVLFLPLGAFMTTLGGSLTQLIVPASLMVVFLTRHRDPFGAAVSCWWLGQNLIDLAPYIDDARNLQLVLLGGKTGAEVEGHDWERILMTLGWLHLDHTLGRLAQAAGVFIMLAACVWAALLLTAHRRRSRLSPNQ